MYPSCINVVVIRRIPIFRWQNWISPLPKSTKEFSSVFFIRISLCNQSRHYCIQCFGYLFAFFRRWFFVTYRKDQSVTAYDFRLDESLKISERASWIINECRIRKIVGVCIFTIIPDYHRVKIWADYFEDGHKCRWRSAADFPFQRPIIATSIAAIQFQTPHIWGKTAKSKFLNDPRYINLIVVSNFIIQSAYTRFNWIKRRRSISHSRCT